MVLQILQDAFFAAIAAIGFAAISRPPRQAYVWCAVIAAVGHSLRYIMMNSDIHVHIIPATFIAALATGTLAVFISPKAKMPAETCLFPALLPMIPGIFAYKAFGGLVLTLFSKAPDTFNANFFLFATNAMICTFILLAMVVGATIPIFVFKKISFTATRK